MDDPVQDQNVRGSGEGIANGSGELPSLPDFKTFLIYKVFCTAYTKIAEEPPFGHFDHLIWPTSGPRGMKPFRDGQEAENGIIRRNPVRARAGETIKGLYVPFGRAW